MSNFEFQNSVRGGTTEVRLAAPHVPVNMSISTAVRELNEQLASSRQRLLRHQQQTEEGVGGGGGVATTTTTTGTIHTWPPLGFQQQQYVPPSSLNIQWHQQHQQKFYHHHHHQQQQQQEHRPRWRSPTWKQYNNNHPSNTESTATPLASGGISSPHSQQQSRSRSQSHRGSDINDTTSNKYKYSNSNTNNNNTDDDSMTAPSLELLNASFMTASLGPSAATTSAVTALFPASPFASPGSSSSSPKFVPASFYSGETSPPTSPARPAIPTTTHHPSSSSSSPHRKRHYHHHHQQQQQQQQLSTSPKQNPWHHIEEGFPTTPTTPASSSSSFPPVAAAAATSSSSSSISSFSLDDLRMQFETIDSNGDGSLDMAELTSYLTGVFSGILRASTNAHLSDREQIAAPTLLELAAATARQALIEADQNGDGKLSFREFASWVRGKEQQQAGGGASPKRNEVAILSAKNDRNQQGSPRDALTSLYSLDNRLDRAEGKSRSAEEEEEGEDDAEVEEEASSSVSEKQTKELKSKYRRSNRRGRERRSEKSSKHHRKNRSSSRSSSVSSESSSSSSNSSHSRGSSGRHRKHSEQRASKTEKPAKKHKSHKKSKESKKDKTRENRKEDKISNIVTPLDITVAVPALNAGNSTSLLHNEKKSVSDTFPTPKVTLAAAAPPVPSPVVSLPSAAPPAPPSPATPAQRLPLLSSLLAISHKNIAEIVLELVMATNEAGFLTFLAYTKFWKDVQKQYLQRQQQQQHREDGDDTTNSTQSNSNKATVAVKQSLLETIWEVFCHPKPSSTTTRQEQQQQQSIGSSAPSADVIDFSVLVAALAPLVQGTRIEKLHALADIFDTGRDHCFTRRGLLRLVSAVLTGLEIFQEVHLLTSSGSSNNTGQQPKKKKSHNTMHSLSRAVVDGCFKEYAKSIQLGSFGSGRESGNKDSGETASVAFPDTIPVQYFADWIQERGLTFLEDTATPTTFSATTTITAVATSSTSTEIGSSTTVSVDGDTAGNGVVYTKVDKTDTNSMQQNPSAAVGMASATCLNVVVVENKSIPVTTSASLGIAVEDENRSRQGPNADKNAKTKTETQANHNLQKSKDKKGGKKIRRHSVSSSESDATSSATSSSSFSSSSSSSSSLSSTTSSRSEEHKKNQRRSKSKARNSQRKEPKGKVDAYIASINQGNNISKDRSRDSLQGIALGGITTSASSQAEATPVITSMLASPPPPPPPPPPFQTLYTGVGVSGSSSPMGYANYYYQTPQHILPSTQQIQPQQQQLQQQLQQHYPQSPQHIFYHPTMDTSSFPQSSLYYYGPSPAAAGGGGGVTSVGVPGVHATLSSSSASAAGALGNTILGADPVSVTPMVIKNSNSYYSNNNNNTMNHNNTGLNGGYYNTFVSSNDNNNNASTMASQNAPTGPTTPSNSARVGILENSNTNTNTTNYTNNFYSQQSQHQAPVAQQHHSYYMQSFQQQQQQQQQQGQGQHYPNFSSSRSPSTQYLALPTRLGNGHATRPKYERTSSSSFTDTGSGEAVAGSEPDTTDRLAWNSASTGATLSEFPASSATGETTANSSLSLSAYRQQQQQQQPPDISPSSVQTGMMSATAAPASINDNSTILTTTTGTTATTATTTTSPPLVWTYFDLASRHCDEVIETFARCADDDGLLSREGFTSCFLSYLRPQYRLQHNHKISLSSSAEQNHYYASNKSSTPSLKSPTVDTTSITVAPAFASSVHPLLDRIFQSFDTDGSGAIDFTELAAGLTGLCGGTSDEKLTAAFDVLDFNGDGHISRDELVLYLTSLFKMTMASEQHQHQHPQRSSSERGGGRTNHVRTGDRSEEKQHHNSREHHSRQQQQPQQPQEQPHPTTMHIRVTPHEIAQATAAEAFASADTNEDGFLSLAEFKSWYAAPPRTPLSATARHTVLQAAAPPMWGANGSSGVGNNDGASVAMPSVGGGGSVLGNGSGNGSGGGLDMATIMRMRLEAEEETTTTTTSGDYFLHQTQDKEKWRLQEQQTQNRYHHRDDDDGHAHTKLSSSSTAAASSVSALRSSSGGHEREQQQTTRTALPPIPPPYTVTAKQNKLQQLPLPSNSPNPSATKAMHLSNTIEQRDESSVPFATSIKQTPLQNSLQNHHQQQQQQQQQQQHPLQYLRETIGFHRLPVSVVLAHFARYADAEPQKGSLMGTASAVITAPQLSLSRRSFNAAVASLVDQVEILRDNERLKGRGKESTTTTTTGKDSSASIGISPSVLAKMRRTRAENNRLLLSRLFDIFDEDHSGRVDFAELLAGISLLCGGGRVENLEEGGSASRGGGRDATATTISSSSTTTTSATTAITTTTTTTSADNDRIAAAFALYDANGDGYIEFHEMTAYLTAVLRVVLQSSSTAPPNATPAALAYATATAAFAEADINQDSRISREEFVAWLTSPGAIQHAAVRALVMQATSVITSDADAVAPSSPSLSSVSASFFDPSTTTTTTTTTSSSTCMATEAVAVASFSQSSPLPQEVENANFVDERIPYAPSIVIGRIVSRRKAKASTLELPESRRGTSGGGDDDASPRPQPLLNNMSSSSAAAAAAAAEGANHGHQLLALPFPPSGPYVPVTSTDPEL